MSTSFSVKKISEAEEVVVDLQSAEAPTVPALEQIAASSVEEVRGSLVWASLVVAEEPFAQEEGAVQRASTATAGLVLTKGVAPETCRCMRSEKAAAGARSRNSTKVEEVPSAGHNRMTKAAEEEQHAGARHASASESLDGIAVEEKRNFAEPGSCRAAAHNTKAARTLAGGN